VFAPGGQYIQVAWVVADLERAMRRWLETARVGPFFLNAHVVTEGLLYRGKPTSVDYSLAIAQAGSIQIELIQQHNDQPSAYRDGVPAGEDGFHHLACFVADFDAELVRLRDQGVETAASGKFGDMRFIYADTRPTLGCMTEVLENTPLIHQIFDRVAEASKGWDGREPIRDIRTLL
jgi:hypothetical protein